MHHMHNACAGELEYLLVIIYVLVDILLLGPYILPIK